MKNLISIFTFLSSVFVFQTAQADDLIINIEQKYCSDGQFEFTVGGSSLPRPGVTCYALTKDSGPSPVSLFVEKRTAAPVGNFANYILKNLANRPNDTYKNIVTDDRTYLVRTAQCGSVQFFVVSLPSIPSSAPVPPSNVCQFDEGKQINAGVSLTGAYPRSSSDTLDQFIADLLK